MGLGNIHLIPLSCVVFNINLLDTKFIEIIFKNSVPISKETQHISMIKINWLVLFRVITDIYSENHMRPINTLCGQNAELRNVNVCGTCSYPRALRT
jgi:hypothetical protein